MTQTLISVGFVRKAHGTNGLVLVVPATECSRVFERTKEIYLVSKHQERQSYQVLDVRAVNNGVLLMLEGVQSKTEADKLVGFKVLVDEPMLDELDEWTFYNYQLVGLSVLTVDGQSVGKISEVLETGANDVYIIDTENGKQVMIPALRSVVKSIDLNTHEMIIDPMENMLD